MEVKILFNYDDNLFCTECKEKVLMGDKIGIVYEQLYSGEIVEKIYHIDCIPVVDEDSYISSEE